MLARIFLRLWMALAVLSPATAAHAACKYDPGATGAAALHDLASAIPEEFRDELELPKDTEVRTDQKGDPTLRPVGCLKAAHIVIYDVRDVDSNGYVSRGYLTGCLNKVEFAPFFVGIIYDDEAWIRAFIAASTDIEDLMGPCNGSISWQYLPNGSVVLFDPVLQKDCVCATRAYVPDNRAGELTLDELFVERLGQTPLAQTVALARQVLINANTSTTATPAPTRTSTSSTDATVVRAGSADPLTPAQFVSRVLSLWRDNDKTGLADRVDNSRWLSEGIVTWYHTGNCDTHPRFGIQAGGGVVLVGMADHMVIGGVLEATVRQNAIGGRLGGYIGADPMTATVSGMPYLGPEFRLLDTGNFQLWMGADLVAPMGPSWAAIGGQGHINFDGIVGARNNIILGGEIGVGGVGAVAGDCESGSLVSSNLRVGF